MHLSSFISFPRLFGNCLVPSFFTLRCQQSIRIKIHFTGGAQTYSTGLEMEIKL